MLINIVWRNIIQKNFAPPFETKERPQKKPIIPFSERMTIVESIKYVDMVVPQTNYDKMEAWNNIKFNIMFVGDDWKGSEKWNGLEEEFSKLGVTIHYFSYTKHTSSTRLRKILDALYKEIEN